MNLWEECIEPLVFIKFNIMVLRYTISRDFIDVFWSFYLIHRRSDEVLSWCCVCCPFIHLSKITISPQVLSRFYSNLYRMFTNYIIMVCRCAPGGSASHTLDFIVVSRKSLANSCSLNKLFAGLTKIHIQISYGLSVVEMVEAASQVLGNFFIGVSSSACCNILGTIFFNIVGNACMYYWSFLHWSN